MLGTKDLKLALELLKKENRFPTTITTGEEMCQVLDFYNQTVDDRIEKDFTRQINGRNKYYAKLALHGLNYGYQAPYKKSSILVSKKVDKDN